MIKAFNTVSWVAAIVIASSLAAVMPAFAQTGARGEWGGGMRGGMMQGVFGTISAVNGTTLTLAASAWPDGETGASSTVYTVDAGSAQIYKDGATSTVSVSSIAVGDEVSVRGTISGTNIVATVIHDGVVRPTGRPVMPGNGIRRFAASSTLPIQGNGQPVIGGSVTAISGTTLTVTNASNVTYTVSAAGATIVKNGTTTALGNIAVGDSVIVQGAVNGTAVTASSIIDQGTKISSLPAPHGNAFGFGLGGFGRFFGAVGGFFRHFFGF